MATSIVQQYGRREGVRSAILTRKRAGRISHRDGTDVLPGMDRSASRGDARAAHDRPMIISDPLGTSIWFILPIIVGASVILGDAWRRRHGTRP